MHRLVRGLGEGFSCGAVAVMDQVGRHHPDRNHNKEGTIRKRKCTVRPGPEVLNPWVTASSMYKVRENRKLRFYFNLTDFLGVFFFSFFLNDRTSSSLFFFSRKFHHRNTQTVTELEQ